MRFALASVAVLGAVVSALALEVHYSTGTEPCSINERWDCGIVNHSPYAVLGGMPVLGRVPGLQNVPVAALGVAGYLSLGVLALLRRKRLALAGALAGLGFSLYLTHIEKDVLLVWCVYCVCSLGIITLLTLLAAGWLVWGSRRR